MKKNYKLIIAVVILFIAGFKMFYDSKTIDSLNNTLIQKEYDRKLLNQQLQKQVKISDSLKMKNDILFKEWEENRPVKIIEKIKIKYEKSKTDIINADNDEQFIIFANWISKENIN